MALESFCASCTYLGERADSYGKYYCSKKGESIYACDPKCRNYCEAYSRSNYGRENMYNYSLESKNSGCYLTTAMCTILNFKDDNYYLQILRTFRNTTMKTNNEYIPLLYTYDTIGPEIAKNLLNDEHQITIAQSLFTRFIIPSVTAIENNKVNDAITIYKAMTQSLAERYNINTSIIIPKIEELDKEKLGHGRSRKRVLTEQSV